LKVTSASLKITGAVAAALAFSLAGAGSALADTTGGTLPAAVTSGSMSVARRCRHCLRRPHLRRPRLQRPEGPVSGWIHRWVQPTVESRPASALVSRHRPRHPRRRLRGRPRQTWASAS